MLFKAFEQVHENDGSMWTNYSGFDQTLWESRTKVDHMERCQAIKEIFEQQGTKASLQRVESTKGLWYSILLDLPYLDPIRYPVVDPMHNLFLGTGKHMMEVWLAQPQLISRKTLDKLEILISEFTIPEGIGHLPTKIMSHFGGFTADQWRNWITIYSPDLRNCWLLFVQAVRMITGCILSQREVNEADSLLQQFFCSKFQELYAAWTANMHMLLHLKQSLSNYGQTYAFWLYAFEQFNGILGSFHTNNNHIESQIMKKFSRKSIHHFRCCGPYG